MTDHALDAFRRLLREGSSGGQAKVDALLALAQRTLYVATFTPGGEELRTLINGNDHTALPLFTHVDELRRAASHFGWDDDGTEPAVRELGARQALRYVIAHGLDYAVVDIASPWRLEAERGELEPLVSGNAEPGPFGGVGRLSSSVMRAVQSTPASSTPGSRRPSSTPPSSPGEATRDASSPPSARPPSAPPSSAPGTARASRPSGVSATPSFLPDGRSLGVPESPPGDAFVDACYDVLKEYPEVEWASWCATQHPETGDPVPAVAMRVDAGFRRRVDEIIEAVEGASVASGVEGIEVLLLDDADLLRTAKTDGIAFYPWRPR